MAVGIHVTLLTGTIHSEVCSLRSLIRPAAPAGRAARLYEFFPSLAARLRHRGNDLSGGEQQMLSIGRALMGNPTLLLLDEPFEGVAQVIVDVMLNGMDRLKRKDDFGILLVEQHAQIALEYAERAIVLDRGRIVYFGGSGPLLAAPERLAGLVRMKLMASVER